VQESAARQTSKRNIHGNECQLESKQITPEFNELSFKAARPSLRTITRAKNLKRFACETLHAKTSNLNNN
jgi:hypothetical protein